jgi:hypothetical protein
MAEKSLVENRPIGETPAIQGPHGGAKDLASKFRNLKQQTPQQPSLT